MQGANGDIPNTKFYAQDVSECCAACSANSECFGYTFNTDDLPPQDQNKDGKIKGRCWLKRATGWTYKTNQPNRISGTVPRTGVPQKPIIDKGCQCDKQGCPSGYSGSWGDSCGGSDCS